MVDPRIEFLEKKNHELWKLLKQHNIYVSSTSSLCPPKHEDKSLDCKEDDYALITTHGPRNIDCDLLEVFNTSFDVVLEVPKSSS